MKNKCYYVYLLRSCSAHHPSKTYIGCTSDYDHRLKQHNGMVEGGANETKRGRPWEFVAVVHGFYGNDNDTNNANANAALSFEAAWQNPSKSLRIRNSIGDREAERLAEDLNGTQRDLAVLKCLLNNNECDDNNNTRNSNRSGSGTSDSANPKFVEFSSEYWRNQYLHANYIIMNYSDSDGDSDGENKKCPSLVPSRVNQSLLLQLPFNTLQRTYSDPAFRWEMLPTPAEIMASLGDLPDPNMWRRVQRISEAIRRADQRNPFVDEWNHHILTARDYHRMRQIDQQGIFYQFQTAIQNTINIHIHCIIWNIPEGCNVFMTREQELNLWKELQEVAWQFDNDEYSDSDSYSDKFQKLFRDATANENENQGNAAQEKAPTQAKTALLVASIVENFLDQEQKRIQQNAPTFVQIADLFDKVKACKDIIPNPTVAKKQQRVSIGTTASATTATATATATSINKRKGRHKFTPKQEKDIRDALQIYGKDYEMILKHANLEDILVLQQIKDKIKNMEKQEHSLVVVSSRGGIIVADNNTNERPLSLPLPPLQMDRTRPQTQRQSVRLEFTSTEDNAILNGVEKYGRGNWIPWGKILQDKVYGTKLKRNNRSIDVIRNRFRCVLQYRKPAVRVIE